MQMELLSTFLWQINIFWQFSGIKISAEITLPSVGEILCSSIPEVTFQKFAETMFPRPHNLLIQNFISPYVLQVSYRTGMMGNLFFLMS